MQDTRIKDDAEKLLAETLKGAAELAKGAEEVAAGLRARTHAILAGELLMHDSMRGGHRHTCRLRGGEQCEQATHNLQGCCVEPSSSNVCR